MWFQIPNSVYFTIFNRYDAELTVFGCCTHTENCSLYDAKILTEWGFRWAKHPMLKSVRKPESQASVGESSDWPVKHYVFINDKDDTDDTQA